jgi:ABC-type sugar transport system ATPase subunit
MHWSVAHRTSNMADRLMKFIKSAQQSTEILTVYVGNPEPVPMMMADQLIFMQRLNFYVISTCYFE